jgi:DNA-binding MarR family transcriptional regulator
MTEVDVVHTAAELRVTIGSLVRAARTRDPMPLAQAGALGYLDREGPMTTSDLAARQQVRQQSMARTISQLVAAGFVRQRPHPSDGRKILIEITDEGRGALEERRGRRVEWLTEAIETRLTPDEQRLLAEAVKLLGRLTDTGQAR